MVTLEGRRVLVQSLAKNSVAASVSSVNKNTVPSFLPALPPYFLPSLLPSFPPSFLPSYSSWLLLPALLPSLLLLSNQKMPKTNPKNAKEEPPPNFDSASCDDKDMDSPSSEARVVHLLDVAALARFAEPPRRQEYPCWQQLCLKKRKLHADGSIKSRYTPISTPCFRTRN